MDLIGIVGVIALLFLIIGLCEPLAARLRLPFSVILAVVGTLIGVAAGYFWATDLTDVLNPLALSILQLPIRANVFLYVFLPTLLFQVSLGLDLRRMLDDWVPILVLAVVAVVAATVTIGAALAWASGLALGACLLIGSIVSTTDPSAVVSIFRSIAAPRRLTRIVEGESLLNDAAAIALFGLFLQIVMSGSEALPLADGLARFPLLILGGGAAGWLLARVAVWVMAMFPRHPLAQISISLALPYLAYIAAEQGLGASGVIAVVVSGLTLNLVGPSRFEPASWENLRETWDLLAHWAGALIFVLAALLIPRLLGEFEIGDVALIMVVTVAAIVARAVILFGVLPLMSMLRLSPHVQGRYRVTILWGGLRGAVTLALALAVTENVLVPAEVKRLVGILATGFTLFTLIVQGASLRWVIGRLGLDQLGPVDSALSNQVIAVALQNVREAIAGIVRDHELTHEIIRSEAKLFGERLDKVVHQAEDGAQILDRDRVTLGLVALAGRERDVILEHFRQRLISSQLVERMLLDADRLIERTRSGGRSEYRAAGRLSLGRGRNYRLAVFLHLRLGYSRLLEKITAEHFEILILQKLILRELHGFIDAKILRIHGRRVADLLHELLARRLEEVGQTLDGLRLQYPGYAEELERRFIRRTALRLEEGEYDILFSDGLIGQELYTMLGQQVAAMRNSTDIRPRLDLAVRKTELVLQFPLFADMDERQRRRLSSALVTIYAQPGEVLARRGDTTKSVHFIASGAVEIETAGQIIRLGRGEMFGQIALLNRRHRRLQVTAITHCTLLRLDEARFMRLLQRNKALQKAVLASAKRRGVSLGPNFFGNGSTEQMATDPDETEPKMLPEPATRP